MRIKADLFPCPITGKEAWMSVCHGVGPVERWVYIHTHHGGRDGKPRLSLFLAAENPEELRPLCEQLARTWNEYLRPHYFICESDQDYNEPYK